MSIKSASIIDTSSKTKYFTQAVKDEPILAVDTESNSLYAYNERVCLIQLSTEKEDFIIDPCKLDLLTDIPILGSIFEDPRKEVVFHAGEYDLMCLKRDYGYRFANIFDTMIGARILGIEKIGLTNLIHMAFNIELDKKYQLHNWALRPLKKEALRYAQMDTHYLLPLRKFLLEKMIETDRLEESNELFEESTHVEWSKDGFSPDQFWKIKGALRLDGEDAAVLRELFIMRDQVARKRDLPVFKIVGDKTLVELALTKPENRSELIDIKGIGKRNIDQMGRQILETIQRGLAAEHPEKPPRPPRLPEDQSDRYERLHAWRKHKAQERGVSSEIIISRDALLEIARNNPMKLDDLNKINGVGPWRLKTYGQEILELL